MGASVGNLHPRGPLNTSGGSSSSAARRRPGVPSVRTRSRKISTEMLDNLERFSRRTISTASHYDQEIANEVASILHEAANEGEDDSEDDDSAFTSPRAPLRSAGGEDTIPEEDERGGRQADHTIS